MDYHYIDNISHYNGYNNSHYYHGHFHSHDFYHYHHHSYYYHDDYYDYYDFYFYTPDFLHSFTFNPFDVLSQNHTKVAEIATKVVTSAIISVGLPLTLMAIYALYSQVRDNHVAPIFVINLLMTDLIQFCCMIDEVVNTKKRKINDLVHHVYLYFLMTSVGFMVCVAMERYVVIAWPLLYRFKRTVTMSVAVCAIVWILPLACLLSVYLYDLFLVEEIILAVFFLLPFPLLIFFLTGTLRALCVTISIPSDQKRQIVAVLVLVLLIYTLLFLPSIIWFLAKKKVSTVLNNLSHVFLKLSPLADLILYVLMKKGTADRLLASACCSRIDSNDVSSLPT